jgi:hypothetical protein
VPISELVSAISPGVFPHAKRPRAKKSEFAKWLRVDNANANEAPDGRPMLSLQDELLLARLRDLALPEMAGTTNPYAKIAGADKTVNEDGQYFLPFGQSGDMLDREV